MNYLRYEITADSTDIIEVALDSQANVKLMDPYNFDRYRRGQSHQYYGGLVKRSPLTLSPPRYGKWYVTVDLGGYAGSVRAGVTVRRCS
jgi:hypothetical protein